MFSFFKPKELRSLSKALREARTTLDENGAFDTIAPQIEHRWQKQKEHFVKSVKAGAAVEMIALAEVTNFSGDLIESGQLCVYRGLLGLEGEAMLRLYKAALNRLVELEFTPRAYADKQITVLLDNLQNVG